MACRPGFFLPVRVLSRLFRRKLLEALGRSFDAGSLRFHGSIAHLEDPSNFWAHLKPLRDKDWMVYAKPPFGSPDCVLKYLARYTHRVAISNHRLLRMEGDRVTFAWKDYAHGSRRKAMTLSAVEFIRRFLLHVLPKGFVRIRHQGFLANRHRRQKVALCRELVAVADPAPPVALAPDVSCEHPAPLCPVCKTGHLVRLRNLSASELAHTLGTNVHDTS